MTIDKMRRRFNISVECPRSLIESESAYLHRLIATGVRYGVGAWCATSKHEACAEAPADSCRCYCHTPTKRFTDAELAAEYWAPNWIANPDLDFDADFNGSLQIMQDRQATILRFAALPHHDQEIS